MAWEVSGFLQSVRAAREALRASAPTRMQEGGALLLEDARGNGDFPYATGSLSLSGTVKDPQWDGDVVTVDVTFGGPSGGPNDPVIYAEPVHDGYDLVAWGHVTGRHIAGRPYLGQPFVAQGPQRWQDAAAATWHDAESAWRSG